MAVDLWRILTSYPRDAWIPKLDISLKTFMNREIFVKPGKLLQIQNIWLGFTDQPYYAELWLITVGD